MILEIRHLKYLIHNKIYSKTYQFQPLNFLHTCLVWCPSPWMEVLGQVSQQDHHFKVLKVYNNFLSTYLNLKRRNRIPFQKNDIKIIHYSFKINMSFKFIFLFISALVNFTFYVNEQISKLNSTIQTKSINSINSISLDYFNMISIV